MALNALFDKERVGRVLDAIDKDGPLPGSKKARPLVEPQRPTEPAGQSREPVATPLKGRNAPGMFVMVTDPFNFSRIEDPKTAHATQELFDAIDEGDLAKAQQAISAGADVQSTRALWNRGGGEAPTLRQLGEEITPLQYAREKKQPGIAKMLASAGAKE